MLFFFEAGPCVPFFVAEFLFLPFLGVPIHRFVISTFLGYDPKAR